MTKEALDKLKHKTVLVKILKEIYSDPDLRNILGFKGGTAALLFYNLPRLSVDLDFNLLDISKKKLVFEKVEKILAKFGKIRQAREKRYTLFFLLSYQKYKRNLKIDISKRAGSTQFELKSYLGIPMLVVKKQSILAGKLSAFLTRRKLASRDLFDLWFFLKKDWQIDKKVLKEKTDLPLKKALRKAIVKTKKIKRRQLLQGLGELLDEKQKVWAREKLREELIFQLKLRL